MMDDNPFRGSLLSGERLLWTGAPARGLLFTARDTFVIPFGLIWCGILSTFFMDVPKSAPLPFYLGLVPFACVGFFMLVGRFVVDAWMRRRTTYAVTNRRILIQRSAPVASFTTLDLGRLPEMKIVGAAGGRGTIRFGSAASQSSQQWSSMLPALDAVPQFLAIEGAHDVFRIILDASRSDVTNSFRGPH